MKNRVYALWGFIFSVLITVYSCNSDDDSSSDNSTGESIMSVDAATSTTCSSSSGFAKLLCLCNEFKASLSSSQLSALQLSYSYSNITTWSNLPAGMSARKGIRLGDLSNAQLALAKAIVKEISGTTTNEGWDEVNQIWLADDYLRSNGGGSTYGSGNYYLAFFGTPASSGTFEIMMTGHHKTVANTYKDASLVAATPHFEAVEPLSFTVSGTSYVPINQEKEAFAAILAGLDSSQLSTAKSSSTFSDILLGPGSNWSFPSSFSGLKCSNLTSSQKQLVLNAVKTYVYDIDDANASSILTTYSSEIDDTYILYSGTTNMGTKADYFRISGPHVWIEFSVQNGVILSGVHYHSVWRDRINDYATTKS